MSLAGSTANLAKICSKGLLCDRLFRGCVFFEKVIEEIE